MVNILLHTEWKSFRYDQKDILPESQRDSGRESWACMGEWEKEKEGEKNKAGKGTGLQHYQPERSWSSLSRPGAASCPKAFLGTVRGHKRDGARLTAARKSTDEQSHTDFSAAFLSVPQSVAWTMSASFLVFAWSQTHNLIILGNDFWLP